MKTKTQFKRIAHDVQPLAPVSAAVPSSTLPQKLPKLTKTFLLAGRALFTVNNGSEHLTFKVRFKENEFPRGSGRVQKTYFVSVKRPGDLRFNYGYIGVLNPDTGTIRCTGASMFLPGSKEYDIAAWATQVVVQGKLVPTQYEIAHAGKCGRCGLLLTEPTSIERGIGPECWRSMQ